MRYRFIAAILLVLFSFSLAGCAQTGQSSDSPDQKPIIAVTIVPEQTFAEAVCGDLADVITMVPAGYSPANYEPTAEEMEQFHNASLYFSHWSSDGRGFDLAERGRRRGGFPAGCRRRRLSRQDV